MFLKDIQNDMFTTHRDPELVTQDEIGVIDNDWIKENFLIKSSDLDSPYNMQRFASMADNKVVDTSMGGNISINCYPQFTRTADPRVKGKVIGRYNTGVREQTNIGMGRYYSEAIDDNSTNVYMEFGVMEQNNPLFYLLSAVDYKKSVIANTGRSPIWYNAGQLFGTAAVVIAFPIVGALMLLTKFAINLGTNLLGSPGKFEQQYHKPTMFEYWSSVNSIVTMMATELGILSPYYMKDKISDKKMGAPLKLDNSDLDNLRKLMPGLITEGNAINVHALVARGQMMQNQYRNAQLEAVKALSDANVKSPDMTRLIAATDNIKNANPGNLRDTLENIVGDDPRFSNITDKTHNTEEESTFTKVLEEIKSTGGYLLDAFTSDDDGAVSRKVRPQDDKSYITKVGDTAKAVFNEGARFAVFRVEHLGSSSVSISNSTTPIGSIDKVNELGETWRNMKMNFGLTSIPGVSALAGGITDLLAGSLDGVTLGASNVVASMLSGAKVDTSERWQSSSTNFPSETYKMTLISPSAHPIAQLRNIYIPLACIMAGSMPRETGPRSHTAPFACTMFVRGRQPISAGYITSMSITRGTSNLSFNKQRRALALEVSFSVSSVATGSLSTPTSGDLLGAGGIMFDDESGLSKYIQSLCSRDLYSTIHASDKARVKISRYLQNIGLHETPEYWGAMIGDTVSNGGIFSIFSDKTRTNYAELY